MAIKINLIKLSILFLFFSFIFTGCKTTKQKETNIKDSPIPEIQDKTYQEEIHQDNEIHQEKIYQLEIDLIEGKSNIFIKGVDYGETPVKLDLLEGEYDIKLIRKNYQDGECKVILNKNRKIIFRHTKESISGIKHLGIYRCGEQPKQVVFSPDDKYIYIPLLEDEGFQVFSTESWEITNFIKPDAPKKNYGFTEGVFIKPKWGNYYSFLVTQMTTSTIYEYRYPDLTFIRKINTEGKWPKYMCYSEDLDYLAVSNWATNNVVIFNYSSGKVIKNIPTAEAPRGLFFSPDNKYLYIACFDGGTLVKINTTTWKEEKSIFVQNSAMRHIVYSLQTEKLFVTNMYHAQVYQVNPEKFFIEKRYKIYYNPNTTDITPDGRYIFVSCRGPNDPNTYLVRSPENGKIAVIDLKNESVISFIAGGNQPTGLDVSNNGKYLCFSNFRDKNIEIYDIGDFIGVQ